MNDFVKLLVDKNDDVYTTIADDGISSAEYDEFIDTGSYALNGQLSGTIYGGVPNNKIVGFAGESATGKTFFMLGIVKTFLDNNPEAIVMYYDTEAAITKDMMRSRGIDTNRLIIAEPDTIQKFKTHVIKTVNKYMEIEQNKRPPFMMVLDSLGMLSTTKEVTDSESGSDTRDMTRAQTIRATFRTITLKLARAKVPMLISNHIYEVVGAYIPTKEVSGGGGFKYAASIIAMLTKKKDKDGTDVVGNIITVNMVKSRISKENTKVEIKLSYDNGLDRYYGLLPFAESAGIFKKVSTRYELPDGSKVFEKTINSNPDKYYTKDILDKIDEYVRLTFKYGQSNTTDEELEEELNEIEG